MVFAEADPSMDISGLDAVYKLVILATVAFKSSTSIQNIQYKGIETITLSDIEYAKELGFSIKLLAIAKLIKDELFLTVRPL